MAENDINDHEIAYALMEGVSKAVPDKGSERDVVTYVSRPMWQAFCRAANIPELSEPTLWSNDGECCRIYGSATIVVDTDKMIAVSITPKL
jgi:hypothetical protein